MEIKKIGHCCLVIKTHNLKILTDPGIWSGEMFGEEKIDLILITHEHADHLHLNSLREVLKKSPTAKIFSVQSVVEILAQEGIVAEALTNGQSVEVLGHIVEAVGERHADIYSEIPPVENTGFLLDNYFFYPGDAFTVPKVNIGILALPVAGPWLKISEVLEYAKKVAPRFAFPVHDGMLAHHDFIYNHCKRFLPGFGTEFIVPDNSKYYNFQK